MESTKDIPKIDPAKEGDRVCDFIREFTLKRFRRKGVVVGLSGGIDSATIAALCVRAIGQDRVLGLLLPEKESNPISLEYGRKQAEKIGIRTVMVDITENLKSFGVYEKRNAVIRRLFPDFSDAFRFHVTLPQNLLEKDRLNYHTITVEDGGGTRYTKRISSGDWLEISACQNMKQRARMIQLYYHAEKNNYIVAGTTNKTEVLQGFYVKGGDGGVDIEPIAHLYKTHVYQLARYLGVIEEILDRPPSPDTYSLPVTDKEFYFCIDYALLDSLLYAHEMNLPLSEVANTLRLQEKQIERVFRDFKAKEQATWHLREMPPSLE
jgi:NAD+ synthase